MPDDLTTLQICLVVAAVFAGAFVKSVTGMGFPLVAIPIMTLFLPTPIAVAVIALPNVVQNVVLVVQHRDAAAEGHHLGRFCAAGIVGAVIGASALTTVPETGVKAVLAAMLVAYFVTVLTSPEFSVPPHRVGLWSAPVGFVSGLFQGGIGISGPAVGTWYHGLRLSQGAFVFSISTVFTLTGAAQVTVLGLRGTLDGRWLVTIGLTGVMFAALPLGTRLRRRLSPDRFRSLVLVVLAASCVSLIVELVAHAI